MRVRESQDFFSLYFDSGVVETATGVVDPHDSVIDWERETKIHGQVPTPQQVAKLMAQWVMSASPKSVLDPAAGLGGLLHECRQINSEVDLVGVECDQNALCMAKRSAPCGTKLILADYLLSDSGSYQGIIANPPYVKAQRLNYSPDTWLAFEERFGTHLDRLTNLYALFLLKIWQDLAEGGRAAVIIPAEFLNANFGVEIKERLVKTIHPSGILVFNPSLNLFSESLTTSAIIFLEKGHRSTSRSILAKADSLEEAATFLNRLLHEEVSGGEGIYYLGDFRPSDKWLNTLLSGRSVAKTSSMPKVIGDYFNCRRGIATGANDFFCLSKSNLEQNGLDFSHIEPCITKATDADGLVFTQDKFLALVESDRRCYLLNPSKNGQALSNYLLAGEKQGIHQRHLPSHRPVWYMPESRPVAEILVAVFSREKIKFIFNTSKAKNLTCFHGLYPKHGNGFLGPITTLYLNSSWGQEAFAKVNRFYGDGLNKLEPKDVEALECPEFPVQTQADFERLRNELLRLEGLSEVIRRSKIDKITSDILGILS